VVGAALAALPLARLTLRSGRRLALALGLGIGALGAVVVVLGAATRTLGLVYLGCLGVGVATASSLQARYAAADLAEEHHRGRALSFVVWGSTVGAVLGPNLLEVSGRLGLALGLPQLAGPYVVAAAALAVAALLLAVMLRPDPYLLARRLAVASGDAVAGARTSVRDGWPTSAPPRAAGHRGGGDRARGDGHGHGDDAGAHAPRRRAPALIGFVISVHVAGCTR
jgi:MFS family permease